MRVKHSALILTAGALLMPTLLWSQFPGMGGAPGGGMGMGRGGFNLEAMFDRLSGGADSINLDQIPPQQRQMLERFGPLMGITISGNQLTRDQFRRAAGQVQSMMGSGQLQIPGMSGGGMNRGAAGGGADAFLDNRFNQMDRNQNGVLEFDELNGSSLQNEVARYDTNNNGVIERDEYRAYVAARVGTGTQPQGAQGGGFNLALQAPQMGQLPQIPNGPMGFAPGGNGLNPFQGNRPFPSTQPQQQVAPPFPFAYLDQDKDTQVGLYEWKNSGRPISEFVSMDLNKDGFLTSEEFSRWRKSQAPQQTVSTGYGLEDPPVANAGAGMNGFGRGGFPGGGMGGMGAGNFGGFNRGGFAQGGMGMGAFGQGGGMGMGNFGQGGSGQGAGFGGMGQGGGFNRFAPGGGLGGATFTPGGGGMGQGAGGFTPGGSGFGGQGGGFNPAANPGDMGGGFGGGRGGRLPGGGFGGGPGGGGFGGGRGGPPQDGAGFGGGPGGGRRGGRGPGG